jgi:hypothetical protein
MPVLRIFISYASEDAAWKNNFTHPDWFGNLIGQNFRTIDYKMGEGLPFGPLNEWLDEQVESAAAMVCIVSKSYIDKKYTLTEWWGALREVGKRNMIFVPVMTDPHAKEWWKEQKRLGNLRELGPGGDYAYANFTDGNGRRLEIIGHQGLALDGVTQKISDIARLIGKHLRAPVQVNAAAPAADRPAAAVAPQPAAQDVAPRAAANGAQVGAPIAEAVSRPVLVLGHPSLALGETVARDTQMLVKALRGDDLVPARWKDGWRAMQAESHGPTELLRRKPMIVQPVGPIEAGDLAKTPALLRDWLNRAVARESAEVIAGAADCDLTVWLPAGHNDPEFVKAVAGQARDAMPMLRYEAPDALAQWLGARVRGARPNVTILTLEELSGVDNVATLRVALHDGFYKLVGEVVNPAPERWVFSGEMLANQLSDLGTDRVIIAVHDLNTGTATQRPDARRELEQKLGAISRAVETAIAAQPKPPKMFRAALLVTKADKLPFVKYPAPSRFEDWCLLPFAQADQGLQPKPVEADMFRGYLREWALN